MWHQHPTPVNAKAERAAYAIGEPAVDPLLAVG
jgi:hypothetical protein